MKMTTINKKYLWISLTLMLLTSAVMVSVPVQAQPSPVIYSVAPWYEHPWAPIFNFSDVNVDVMIDSPVGAGILTVVVSLRWDPSVLSLGFEYPWNLPGVKTEYTEGTFLSDWCTAYPWPAGTSLFPGAIDYAGGTAELFTISINLWTNLPYGDGADGAGKLITFHFTPLNTTAAYSPLDLIDGDIEFFTHDGGFPADEVIDGNYGVPPPAVPEITLVQWKAKAEHSHFDVSKDGDLLVSDRHGTPGYQTLYGNIKNTGTIYTNVRVAFQLMGPIPVSMVTDGELLAPGAKTTLTVNFAGTTGYPWDGTDEVTWTVTAQGEYKDPDTGIWTPLGAIKTFKFTVVP